MPTATPTPAPTATPTPRPPLPALPPPAARDDPAVALTDVEGYNELQQSMPERARLFRELPWVDDGLVESERRAAEALLNIGLQWGDVFLGLMEKPWLAEGMTNDKETVIAYLLGVAAGGFSSSAAEIIGMPFLDSVQAADALAVWSLGRLALSREDVFRQIMANPTVSDGITDAEAKIVAILTPSKTPTLVQALLTPDVAMLEEREIDAPGAGEVLITIIRTQPGEYETMDMAEEAAKHIGEFMGTPWPVQNIIIFSESGADYAGRNWGSHFEFRAAFEAGSVPPHNLYGLISHEIAHFFDSGTEPWIGEGGADFLNAISLNARYGWPISPIGGTCTGARTIQEWEEQDRTVRDWLCAYDLGSRLFLDLYHQMDPTAFREGRRRLYLMSQYDDGTSSCEGPRVGICRLEAAFKEGATQEAADIVDEAIARWYYGTEPWSTRRPVQRDDSPAEDPVLPSATVRVQEAYVTGQAAGHIRLHLEIATSGFPPSSEDWPLEITEYSEEDGFLFGRNPYKWNWGGRTAEFGLFAKLPGNYRVYAYWNGQKIAEVSYVVKPPDEVVTIRGTVIGPTGQPLEEVGVWAGGQSADGRSVWTGVWTGEDGSFAIQVPDGSFNLSVYATGGGLTLIGWYGPGGFTTVHEEATFIEVDGQSVEDILIRLPDHPDALPGV